MEPYKLKILKNISENRYTVVFAVPDDISINLLNEFKSNKYDVKEKYYPCNCDNGCEYCLNKWYAVTFTKDVISFNF
jgi:hypothetical protein